MNLYSRLIFPRLCDGVMGDPEMAKLRSEALADVCGQVLEIGFGTGLNLAHYPKHVGRITIADPNPGRRHGGYGRASGARGIRPDLAAMATASASTGVLR